MLSNTVEVFYKISYSYEKKSGSDDQYHDNRRQKKKTALASGHIIIAPKTKNSMVRSLKEHHLPK